MLSPAPKSALDVAQNISDEAQDIDDIAIEPVTYEHQEHIIINIVTKIAVK